MKVQAEQLVVILLMMQILFLQFKHDREKLKQTEIVLPLAQMAI